MSVAESIAENLAAAAEARAETPETAETATRDGLQPSSDRRMSKEEGARKAAIALMMLGNEIATELLRVMPDDEVRLLLRSAGGIKNIRPEEAVEVLEEFVGYFDGSSLLLPRAGRFVRDLAEETFGKERVQRLLSEDTEPAPEPEPEPEVLSDEPEAMIARALEAGAEALAKVLKKEHPQTVAVALAVMHTGKSAEVLGFLPADMRSDIVRRVAQIKTVPPSLIREIAETLRRELDRSTSDAMDVDGTNTVVGLLKALSQEEEDLIFEGLNESDPEMAEAIRKKMFVFEDFMGLDPRALQQMLKEIDGRTLTLALKTATTSLREHILSAMSSRAATMIIEDLDAMGPVAVSQVESAQDEIVQVALRLAGEGKISLR
jgi:flagellar motor switch protein FliG